MKEKSSHQPHNPEPAGKGIFYNVQQLADRSLDGIYHYAVDERRFLFYNRQFAQLFGLKIADNRTVHAKHVLNRIHPDDQEKVRTYFESILKSGIDNGDIQFRLLQPDGDIRWVHDRWITVQEKDTIAIEGFMRDITEEKLAIEKFLDSKQNAPIGTFIVQDDMFKYVNTEFIRIIGYSKEELLGSNPFTYIHEDYRDYVRQQAIAMLKRKSTTPYEFCIHNKAGEIRWIMETVTPINYGGRRATLGYFMDITRLHKMQLNLSSLGLMVGTISHSLKGCLTGLDASLYLIETGFYRNKPARIEEGLDVTKLMADRIRKLVMDILYYAKERELQLTNVDVWQFAKDVATSIETRIRAANIQFECNLPTDLGTFDIDTETLRPALINLLENAMEACIEDQSDKKHVIRFDVHGEKDQVVFEVSDNGPGIESDHVPRIFRLFYSSKGHKGTGIGLFITRKVILKHGGRITVNTEHGNGALFKVFLPRNPIEGKGPS
jgi:PAS domain S-box-containing protein